MLPLGHYIIGIQMYKILKLLFKQRKYLGLFKGWLHYVLLSAYVTLNTINMQFGNSLSRQFQSDILESQYLELRMYFAKAM